MKQYILFATILLTVPYLPTGCGANVGAYEMPDGALCKWGRFPERAKIGQTWHSPTTEFWGCDNGQRYVNPSSYREVKRLK